MRARMSAFSVCKRTILHRTGGPNVESGQAGAVVPRCCLATRHMVP